MGKNLTLVGRRGTGLALRGGWHRILGMGMLAAGLALVVLSAAGGQSNALSPVPSVTVLHLADCRPGSPVAPVIAIAGGDWDDGECESNKEGIVTRLANWFTDDFIDGIGTSISVDGDGRTTASWSNGKDRLKIRIEGKVEFGDDDRTISNISRGGYVAIQEKRHGVKTELEIEPDGDGGFEYDYRVNGKRMTFDEAGRNWLGDVLLDVIRKTGVGAEARANRILDRDGVAGLLDEVRMVESDYVMRIFVGAALERPDLTSADCSAILREAGASMDSDYEKAELLLEVADHRSWNSSLVGDYVAVAATMSSDYETRRALSAIELDEDTSQDVIDQLLRVAARMNSDYEKSELLISLAPSCERSQRLMEMYVEAVADIDSDYEARRALSQLDWRGGIPASAVASILQTAAHFSSDYETAELLIETAPFCDSDDRTVGAYMAAAMRIDSDYETGRVLAAFTSNADLTDYSVLAIIEVVGGMSSSYEKCGVLRGLARHCRGNEKLEDAYLDAVDAVGSDYERDNLFSEFYRGVGRTPKSSGAY